MDLFVDDDGFVRAPALKVYRCLTDIDGWGGWWPGVATEPASGVALEEEDAEAWRLVWRDRWRRLQMTVVAHGWRHEAGFELELVGGDLTGGAEFWLEEAHGGTVVHHILRGATPRRRPLPVLKSYRRVLRRGLWALKDRLQTQVREDLGLLP
ncbi:MAG: SRPBCC family protein [Nitriliruptorales bacterium]|nr:SRPBCC family protein [Nitriliruptorales bacterium]